MIFWLFSPEVWWRWRRQQWTYPMKQIKNMPPIGTSQWEAPKQQQKSSFLSSFFEKISWKNFISYFMKGIKVILENCIACHINKYWIRWIIFCNYWWNQNYFVFMYTDISILFLTWIAYFEREGYYKSCTGEVTVSLAEVVSRKEHPTYKIIPQVKSV